MTAAFPTLLLVLFSSVVSFGQTETTLAPKTREINILETAPKKNICRQVDDYLMLFDYNDFVTSINKVSSKSTKLIASATDRKKLKDYLTVYFTSHDTLITSDTILPVNIDNIFIWVFADYLKDRLNNGGLSVYNTTKKKYEKIIVKEIEEKIGDNNVMGIKIKETVLVLNTVTTYYTENKTTALFKLTDTKTRDK